MLGEVIAGVTVRGIGGREAQPAVDDRGDLGGLAVSGPAWANGVPGHPRGGRYGRLRPRRSCAATHSSATTADPSEISPHNTVAATISANLRTWPGP